MEEKEKGEEMEESMEEIESFNYVIFRKLNDKINSEEKFILDFFEIENKEECWKCVLKDDKDIILGIINFDPKNEEYKYCSQGMDYTISELLDIIDFTLILKKRYLDNLEEKILKGKLEIDNLGAEGSDL